MREEKRITQEDIDRARVRLKSLLGIKPESWLAALFALAILALLFALLVLPGLSRNGSVLVLDSRPRGAAVLVDGAYVGATPCEAFVAKGEHRVEMSRPLFAAKALSLDAGGRILGSLFFPRRTRVSAVLEAEDPKALVLESYREFSLWSLAGRPSATYQYPLVLSESLLALCEAGVAFPRAEAPSLAAAALAASASEHSARDALRAAFLAASAPSPLGLVTGFEVLRTAVGGNPALEPWLEALLPQAARERLLAAPGAAALRAAAAKVFAPGARVEAPRPADPTGGGLSFAGFSFRPVPGGNFAAKGEAPDGGSVAYRVDLEDFHLSETETTRRQWRAFLAELPEWGPGLRAPLVEAGKADPAYLADWDDAGIPEDAPVTGVSWEAARAFCAWLSVKAPSGYEAVLPSEAMWERAAVLGGSEATAAVFHAIDRTGPAPAASRGRDGLGLADMLGNVWEWCSDAYLPYPALAPEAGPWEGPERSVRGGSWANRAGTVGAASRGSFPPSFASPFLGFRPALVRTRRPR